MATTQDATVGPTLTTEDWIVCLANREARGLRQRHPDVKILSTNLDGLRGLTLRGRVFITALAERRVSMVHLQDLVALCTLSTGADPTIHRIGG